MSLIMENIQSIENTIHLFDRAKKTVTCN